MDRFEVGMAVVLCLLIAGSAIAIGCVAPLGRSLVLCASVLLVVLWFFRGLRRGAIEIVKTWAWLPIVAWFALLGLQMTPLPVEWVARLSPGALQEYRFVLGGAMPERLTLSLHPYGTLCEFMRIGALFGVFFVTLHFVRSRKHAVILIVALIAIALFETLYGMAQRFTEGALSPIRSTDAQSVGTLAVAGTFWSKNNLAALLSMAVLAGAGVLMAFFGREERSSHGTRADVIEMFSSSGGAATAMLVLSLLVIGIGLCLTLSRGAIGATFIAAVIFAICAVTAVQSRRYVLYLVVLAVAVAIALAIVGMEVVASRVEDVAQGRAASWGDRLNMLASGWDMFKDHWLLGAGAGSLRFAFERYQSARFGDFIVDYLHNDWAQILCDAGVVGMALVLAVVVLLVITTFVAALRQKDHFNRWIALGSLLGVVSLLAHSLVDFNLSKVTSNGVVFAVLLAVAYSMARRGGERGDGPACWRIPIGPVALRWALGGVGVAAAVVLCVIPVRMALADYLVNKAATGVRKMVRDNYFFLPVEADLTDAESTEYVARAIRLDPRNPSLWYNMALNRMGVIENAIAAQARDKARELLGEHAAESPDRVEALAPALTIAVAPVVMAERRDEIPVALADAQKAVGLLPVAAKYHLYVAELAAQLMDVATDPADKAAKAGIARREAELARWLATRKPTILFRTGRIELRCAEVAVDESVRKSLETEAMASFRRAIIGNPSYTAIVYPILLARKIGGESPLLAVTPKTPRAYQYLARVLWQQGMWDDLLRCLDVLEVLYTEEIAMEDVSPWLLRKGEMKQESDAPSLTDADYVEMDRYQFKNELVRWRYSLLQRRAAVLGILGRWDEWRAATARCRAFLAETLATKLDDALAARQLRDFDRGLDAFRVLVRADWTNASYLLAMADLCQAMKRPSVAPNWEGALNLLYRVVINSDRLPPAVMSKMRSTIDKINPQSDEDRVVAAFIRGAGAVISGDPEGGVRTLEELAAQNSKAVGMWRQRHLIWFYTGIGYDRLRAPAKALKAYRRVVEFVPTHRESLKRIVELAPGDAWPAENALRDLTPDTSCEIHFGGRLILRGYSLSHDVASRRVWSSRAGTGDWYLTCFWEARDRISNKYVCNLQLLSPDWSVVAESNERIRNVGKLYPVDFPQCGEMVVDRIRLEEDPREARYLKMSVAIPERGIAETALLNDCGQTETILTLWPQSDRTGARTPPVGR